MLALSSISIVALVALIKASSAATSEVCPTIYADLHRRQLEHFSEDGVFTREGGETKHVPVLTFDATGNTATIVVGNGDEEGGVYHPMVPSTDPDVVHWVTHIMVKDQNGNIVGMESLDPSSAVPATAAFEVPAGVTELTPYAFCNIHGLWVGETVTNPGEGSGEASCTVNQFPEGAWESLHADFTRQQKDAFSSDVPYGEAEGVKHVPFITLNNDGTASVFVGKALPEGPAHPMDGVTNVTETPHWITEIYVVDQTGTNIIAMVTLDPTDTNTATASFTVPDGVESMKAYAWCNIHGLYEGPVLEVASADSATSGESAAAMCSAIVGVGAAFASSAVAFNIF